MFYYTVNQIRLRHNSHKKGECLNKLSGRFPYSPKITYLTY
jgi:hypothetical protein